jgi:polyisoprenoid-binding protein YceI
MKKRVAFVLFFLLGTGLLFAQSKKINYAKSSIRFIIKNAGLKVDGKFESFVIDFAFDSQNLSSTKLDAAIKTTSINTGIDGRDKHLRKSEFFNVAEFPTIHFKVTSVKVVSPNNYILQGKLTMKDVTKDISLPMKISKVGTEEVFESTVVLNRLDYHVGEDSWVMSDDVTVSLKIVTE